MSYCINPTCPNPRNQDDNKGIKCQACGTNLLLKNRYRAIKALAQGGFGATFVARDEGLPNFPPCVIKQLRPASTTPEVFQMARELFAREARTLAKIGDHPQVPKLIDYFEEGQQFYLVQEYISGLTLQQEIKRSGPMSEAGAKQFLSEILPVLRDLHNQGVIHRDIKPANIIRRHHDRKLVMIDFGAVKNNNAQTTVQGGSEQTALTAFAIGTPGFAPPEQMSLRPVKASDLYALGVTCIYLLTGKSPKDLDYNQSTGEMLWRNSVHISDNFAKVIEKMLEPSVKSRYQTADDVLRALDLEPYMDSLAQSLASAPSSQKRPSESSFSTTSNNSDLSSSSTSSHISKMAESIRAKRSKSPAGPASRNLAQTTQGQVAKVSPSSDKQVNRKLDPVAILNAYNKGRRDFVGQDLSALNLQRVNLAEVNLHHANLSKTNLQQADLSKADFGGANVTLALLKNANLARAYFSGANLEGADLRGADLSYAYLLNANLCGANLCGANLTGAKVTDEQLALAKTNWSTILPSGKRALW